MSKNLKTVIVVLALVVIVGVLTVWFKDNWKDVFNGFSDWVHTQTGGSGSGFHLPGGGGST